MPFPPKYYPHSNSVPFKYMYMVSIHMQTTFNHCRMFFYGHCKCFVFWNKENLPRIKPGQTFDSRYYPDQILQQTTLSFFICSVSQTEQTALDDGLFMHYCPVNYWFKPEILTDWWRGIHLRNLHVCILKSCMHQASEPEVTSQISLCIFFSK